jgi:hypothetical protein
MWSPTLYAPQPPGQGRLPYPDDPERRRPMCSPTSHVRGGWARRLLQVGSRLWLGTRRAQAPVRQPDRRLEPRNRAGYPKSSTVAANVPPVKPLVVWQSVAFPWLSGVMISGWSEPTTFPAAS